jgi:hypothetical protein
VGLIDAAGQPIAFQTQNLSKKLETPFGRTTIESLHAELGAWFRAQKVRAEDHLLFTLVDWEQGTIQLDREAFSQHGPDQCAARNRLQADLFHGLLESAVSEVIYARAAVATASARRPDKSGYPPDHWMAALAANERLTIDSWRIRYSDSGFGMCQRVLDTGGEV